MQALAPLDERQARHVDTLYEMACDPHKRVIIDKTTMGGGKTYQGLMLHIRLGMPVLIICPANLRKNWQNITCEYTSQLNVLDILSYETLRGMQRRTKASEGIIETKLNHGYLVRYDEYRSFQNKEGTYRSVFFEPSDYWKNLVQERGIMVIIDEIQAAKNASPLTHAVQALIRPVIESVQGRVLLMSGSPFDKQEHVRQLLVTMGIMDGRLYELSKCEDGLTRINIANLSKMLDYCSHLSPGRTQVIWNAIMPLNVIPLLCGFARESATESLVQERKRIILFEPDPSTIQMSLAAIEQLRAKNAGRPQIEREIKRLYERVLRCVNPFKEGPWLRSLFDRLVYDLFIQVLLPELSVDAPMTNTHKLYTANGFFRLPKSQAQTLSLSLGKMLSQITMAKRDREADTNFHDLMKHITKGLVQSEAIKVDILERLVIQTLARHPTMKVVIGMGYISSLEDLCERLQTKHDMKVLTVQGSTSEARRHENRKLFQRPDTEYRIMLGNLHVISQGIDLDDQHGGFPRLALLVPDYFTIRQYQFTGRIMRANTKSDAYLITVYARTDGAYLDDQSLPLPGVDQVHEIALQAYERGYTDQDAPYSSEVSLLSALASKACVIASITGKVRHMLPGLAPHWVESDQK